MADCIFCRIAAGEIPTDLLHADDEIVAFRDVDPQAPTHILVIPRQHISSLLEVGEEQVDLLGRLQQAAVEVARREGLDRDGFRIVTNCLEGGGQAVEQTAG